jgi:hypothetical protein
MYVYLVYSCFIALAQNEEGSGGDILIGGGSISSVFM